VPLLLQDHPDILEAAILRVVKPLDIELCRYCNSAISHHNAQSLDAVAVMAKSLPDEQATEVTDNLSKLVEEATKLKPNMKWYSVSINSLIKAAENVEKVGKPVINLSRKVLSLLTGGAIK